MTSEATATAVVRTAGSTFEFSPHNCFACGTLNTHGMQLDLHIEAGRCWTELSLEPRFEGWEGIAHGGIVCTILDEVMAWSLVGADNWGVTAKLSVAFKRPIHVGQPIRADGWVTKERRRLVAVRRDERHGPGRDLAARSLGGQRGHFAATRPGTSVPARKS